MNKVRRVCFGGALLHALFFEKVFFVKKDKFLKKVSFCEIVLPTLRVTGRCS